MAGKDFGKLRLQRESRFLKWLFISTAFASFVAIWLLGSLKISKVTPPCPENFFFVKGRIEVFLLKTYFDPETQL